MTLSHIDSMPNNLRTAFAHTLELLMRLIMMERWTLRVWHGVNATFTWHKSIRNIHKNRQMDMPNERTKLYRILFLFLFLFFVYFFGASIHFHFINQVCIKDKQSRTQYHICVNRVNDNDSHAPYTPQSAATMTTTAREYRACKVEWSWKNRRKQKWGTMTNVSISKMSNRKTTINWCNTTRFPWFILCTVRAFDAKKQYLSIKN